MRSDQATVGIAVVGASDKRQRANFATGFLCSVALHGMVLLPLLLERRDAIITNVVPIEIVLADETANPAHASEEQEEKASSPAAAPVGVSPSDEFESRLQRLAKLRQPGTEAPISNSRRSLVSPGDNGQSSAASDFIRAQVERRWSLDLAMLGNRTFSVLIRIEMTGAGVVTKADIVKDARFAADKTYQDIARSARNAVLLSSPFALPSGHYADLMELTLSLNTRDALR